MNRAYVDLHIHSALSPCAEDEMTPNNIVNMAALKGLHFIAVTDHNAIDNVAPTIAAAANLDLQVVPGIEITTQEEVHLLAYFHTIKQLVQFYDEIKSTLPSLNNRTDIFGHQYIFDQSDHILSEDPRLLMNAMQISFEQMVHLIRKHHGIPVPAHVNRNSFSVLSNLGFIPAGLPITTVEIVVYPGSKHDPLQFEQYRQMISSDAHNLGSILEQVFFIELNEIEVNELLNWLNTPKAGDET